MKIFIILALLFQSPFLFAELKKQKNKIQEITFDEMDIKGNARTPDGAYLVQRRGLRFMPLHQVKQNFDSRIRGSVMHMK